MFWNGALSLEWADGALQSYARNLERDSALFEQAAADLVSAPEIDSGVWHADRRVLLA
ncbi:hypothetical protein [Mycobacterium avium]|uniref:hypothetical protein n=1 Tax=Mycobacterium avium TaxID=1764 RepID=UPI000AC3F6DA